MGSGDLPGSLEVWPEMPCVDQLTVCVFLAQQVGCLCNGADWVWRFILHVNSGASFSQAHLCLL